MDVQCNTEYGLHYQCCPGRAINITYSERLFAALIIQHANGIFSAERYVINGLFGCTIFSFIVLKTAWIFGKSFWT
jgi:hypothetical protein